MRFLREARSMSRTDVERSGVEAVVGEGRDKRDAENCAELLPAPVGMEPTLGFAA